jgi:hypothetical protein
MLASRTIEGNWLSLADDADRRERSEQSCAGATLRDRATDSRHPYTHQTREAVVQVYLTIDSRSLLQVSS